MNSSICHAPLEWDALLAYWLGELDADRAAQIEEHYLGCEVCSQRLEQFVALSQGVRVLARNSGINAVVNEGYVRRLLDDGRQVREYRVPLNGSVNCTVTPDDDFVLAYLEAPLEGVKRLDMVQIDADGNIALRSEDIPFVANSGGVVWVTNINELRAMPISTLRLRLLAVDASKETSLGEYRFNHTPHSH